MESVAKLKLKDRFLNFATVFKYLSYTNYPLSVVTLVLIMLVSLFISILPMISYLNAPKGIPTSDSNIFPPSQILDYVTPNLIPTYLWLFISFVIIFITLLTFLICIYNVSAIIHTHIILNPHIHWVLLPFLTISFGYSIFLFRNESSPVRAEEIFGILNVLTFPFYVLLLSRLSLIETNTIISPNPIFAEWFYGYSSYNIYIEVVSTLLSTFVYRFDTPTRDILLSVSLLINVSYAILLIVKMPFVIFFVDQILTTKFLMTALTNLLCMLVVEIANVSATWIMVLIPIIYSAVYLVVRLITEKKRDSMHQYLKQFDHTVGAFTVSALRMTLTSSIKSENEIQWVIRECFLSGNTDLLSQTFIQYCLQMFPKSQWLVSIVAFLFAIVWGSNSTVYTVLLHLLSLDQFSTCATLVLYQSIYCLMQTMPNPSPIITRDLEEYRMMMAQYADLHKIFWGSAASSDYQTFHGCILDVCHMANCLLHALKTLRSKYPYSPLVEFELSLYYSDVQHDYIKSDNHFNRGLVLLNQKNVVSTDLFSEFVMFPMYHACNPLRNPNTESKELKFLSFHENYEHARRFLTQTITTDEYFSTLSHTFSVPKEQPIVQINFDQLRLVFLKILFFISIIVFIVVIVAQLAISSSIRTDTTKYVERLECINYTIEFRWKLRAAYMDSLVIFNNYRSAFNNLESDKKFHNFMFKHMQILDDDIIRIFNYFSMPNSVVSDAIYSYGCNSSTCSFSYLTGTVHYVFNYFNKLMEMNAMSLIAQNLIIYDFQNSTNELLDYCNYIFKYLVEQHNNCLDEMWDKFQPDVIFLIVVQVIACSVIFTIYFVINRQMHANLYEVIHTVQPSVLKEVAHYYDNLIHFVAHDKKQSQISFHPRMLTLYFLSVAVLTVFPVYLVIVVKFQNNFPNINPTLPPLPRMNINTQYIAYMIAYLEYILYSEAEDLNSTTNLEEAQLALNSEYGCVHYLMQSTCDECMPPIPFFENSSSQMHIVLMFSLMFVSLLLFIFYIYDATHVIQILKQTHYLLQYIPESAQMSNPVISKLLKGEKIQLEEVQMFNNEIRTSLAFDNTFCVLHINDDGEFDEYHGECESFLTFVPKSLTELEDKLISMNCASSDVIHDFIAERLPNNPRSISISDGKEVSLSFTNNKSILIIKDNSLNYELNQRTRMAHKMQTFETQKSESIQEAFIILIGTDDYNQIEQITRISQDFQPIDLLDTRNHKLTFIMRVQDRYKDSQICLLFVKQLKHKIKHMKCVVHYSTPLYVLGSMNQTVKSRLFGQGYDTARLLLNSISKKTVVTEIILDFSQEDKSKYQIKEFALSNDNIVRIIYY